MPKPCVHRRLRDITSTFARVKLYLDDLVRFAAGADVVSSFAAVARPPFFSGVFFSPAPVFFSAGCVVVDALVRLARVADLVCVSGSGAYGSSPSSSSPPPPPP